MADVLYILGDPVKTNRDVGEGLPGVLALYTHSDSHRHSDSDSDSDSHSQTTESVSVSDTGQLLLWQ